MRTTTTTINASPPFLFDYLGALVFTVAAAVLLRRGGARSAARWTLAALLRYLVTVTITTGVHFPLNDTLVDAGDPDRIADLAALGRAPHLMASSRPSRPAASPRSAAR